MPSTVSTSDTPLLIGDSPTMAALRAEIAAAARTHAKVMILGETGVGKEVVCRLIHHASARHRSPFVAVNCSGIPETLLESELFGHVRGSFTGAFRDKVGLIKQAHRGTLFLDELGEMSLRMQAVLLRFAESGEVQPVGVEGPATRADVRLITATNRDLGAQIVAGTFREDLFYRLNVIRIVIPPLRDRGDDILLLLEHYLRRFAAAHGVGTPVFASDAQDVLLRYGWPGNVRELRNIAERLALQDRGRPLTRDDVPREILSGSGQSAVSAPTANPALTVGPRATALPTSTRAGGEKVARLWNRMEAGEDFWTVVHHAFKTRELTRTELAAVVDRGLQTTRGSYRALLKVFNLPLTDYKRLHAFLYQQQCNLPVGPYRQLRPVSEPPAYEVAS